VSATPAPRPRPARPRPAQTLPDSAQALRPASPRRTVPLTIGQLATALGLPPVDAAVPDAVLTPITGLTHDSREVRPGDVYAALPGARTHGAAFAGSAAACGAVAVLTDDAGAALAAEAGLPVLSVPDVRAVLGAAAVAVYDDPSADLLLVGVTGTNGKTTTAYLVEAGLRAAGHTTGLLGTVETRIAGSAVPSVRTTPEAPELQALFAVMRERGVSAAAMEVSSHALAYGRVDGTRFAASGFTNLSQDHLDFHADLEDYFAAKARLFDGRSRVEVVDVDDAYGRRLVRPGTVTVSGRGTPTATWRATGIDVGPRGSTFRLHGPGGVDLPASVQLPGAFNVANAVLAVALLVAVGVEADIAVAGIAALPGVPGRLERVDPGEPTDAGPGSAGGAEPAAPLALVDYAHTPVAVASLLAALREVTRGRLLVVLGCGGDRDRAKRPLMGAAAARGADLVVITDDNPRSEDPAAIRSAMRDGAAAVPPGERAEVLEVGDRREAIAAALHRAGPGDTLVVAGKGHEQGQDAGGVVHPFDDRAVLRELLAERGAHPAAGPASASPGVAPAGQAGA